MRLDQMQEYLQANRGVPVVLRKQGTTSVRCVYCRKLHDHSEPAGYHEAFCDEKDRLNGGIVIGDRYFIPGYGYFIYDFKEAEGVNELVVPEEELLTVVVPYFT